MGYAGPSRWRTRGQDGEGSILEQMGRWLLPMALVLVDLSKRASGGSVVRTLLPMQETWVQSLIQEDPTCPGTTKPVRHRY